MVDININGMLIMRGPLFHRLKIAMLYLFEFHAFKLNQCKSLNLFQVEEAQFF